MISKTKWQLKYPEANMDLPLAKRLMESRGISEDDIKNESELFAETNKIPDIKPATKRIIEAINNHERIMVHGDYDVDGIMSTAIMVLGLKELGAEEVVYHIPDRLNDGYGISPKSIETIMIDGPNLLITVDCGITSIEQVEEINMLGTDVIITDHHNCKESLPNAVAVIDLKRADNEYMFNELCGAGLAYKIIDHIAKEMNVSINRERYIQYAALATIADVVPLVSENRAIVIKGLEQIKTKPTFVVEALLKTADKYNDIKRLTAQDIAFYVAPMINAASRMGNVAPSIDMMLTDNKEAIMSYAEELSSLNQQRKDVEAQITYDATQFLMHTHNFKSSNAIIVYGSNWHAGVIGIVAAKLAENYGKPTFMMTTADGITYHGSCRTYGNIDIMKMLDYAQKHIIQYGGHTGAAGLTINANEINNFAAAINEYMGSVREEDIEPVKIAEMNILTDDITIENIEAINQLEPFGEKNPEPLFICQSLKTKVLKRIGSKAGSENAHIKITFCDREDPNKTIEGIGFFMGDLYDIIGTGAKVNVLCSLSINEWNGKKTPQLIIKEIRFKSSFNPATNTEVSDLYDDEIVTISDIAESAGISKEEVLPTQYEYVKIVEHTRAILGTAGNSVINTTLDILTSVLSTKLGVELTPFKVARVLATADEATQLIYRKNLFNKILVTSWPATQKKGRLSLTNTYIKDHSC